MATKKQYEQAKRDLADICRYADRTGDPVKDERANIAEERCRDVIAEYEAAKAEAELDRLIRRARKVIAEGQTKNASDGSAVATLGMCRVERRRLDDGRTSVAITHRDDQCFFTASDTWRPEFLL